MSAIIRLLTPMTDEECLLKALEGPPLADAPARSHMGLISVTHGYRARRFVPGAMGFTLEIQDGLQRQEAAVWLAKVNERYMELVAEKGERLAAEERARLEAERARLRAEQEKRVLEKAKALGYRVDKRTEVEGAVRLVLVRKLG